MNSILNKIEEYLKPIYLGLVSLHAVRRTVEITMLSRFVWANSFMSYSLYLIFAICIAKLVIDFITHNMDKRVIYIFLSGLVVLFIIYFFSKSTSGLFFWILICASHNVDYNDIIKTASITMASMLAIVFIGCAMGILENVCLIQNGGTRARYSLGFLEGNCTSHYVFFAIIAWLYWRKEKISWIELVICMVANVVVFKYANTKNPFCIGAVALIACALIKQFSNMRCYKKTYGVIATIIHPICALGSLALFAFYSNSSEIWNKANDFLTYRLELGNSAIDNYGIKLFGQDIEWIGVWQGYNIVDSSYLYILISYGIVFLLIALAMFVAMGIKSAKKKDTYFMIATVAIALHGMFDQCLLSMGYDVFIYFMSYLFADTYIKGLVNEE